MRILDHLLGRSGYNKKGEEIPDPTPRELKIDLEAEMPLELKVMRAIRSEEWVHLMEKQGRESFQEANDFDIDEEEPEFKSFHENDEGDMLAFEEGVKRGFVEEVPVELKERAAKQDQAIKTYYKNKAKAKKEPEPDKEAPQ